MDKPRAAPTAAKVLVVEGVDDKHVIRHICLRNNVELSFSTVVKGSVENVVGTMGEEASVPGRQVVGFVLDANNDVAGRWQAMRGRLNRVGIVLPDEPHPSGTIVSGAPGAGTPRVGVWLMPDNSSDGEIEDFVQTMIPEGDPVWPLSKDYIRSIPTKDRKFKRTKGRRAEVYAWLATRRTPGRMGTAIRAKDLDVTGVLCIRFSEWIRNLFGGG